ncbi:MAG: hypothetical protein IPO71_01030 [Nitrosomonas sp.]|nr:hypothetical protein [Nitrosomonas sp.]
MEAAIRPSHYAGQWQIRLCPLADLAKKPEFANLHRLAALARIFILLCSGHDKLIRPFLRIQIKDIQLIPENWHQDPSLLITPQTPSFHYRVKCGEASGYGSIHLQDRPMRSSSYSAVPILINWETGYPFPLDHETHPFLWDQYDQTRDIIPDLLKILEKNMATMFPSRPPVIL